MVVTTIQRIPPSHTILSEDDISLHLVADSCKALQFLLTTKEEKKIQSNYSSTKATLNL